MAEQTITKFPPVEQDLNYAAIRKGAKFVCEDLNNIVNSMNLIIECFDRQGDRENISHYNDWLLESMVEALKDTLKNTADELYNNLGIARIMKLDNP